MRRAVLNEFNQLGEKLTNYTSMFSFRLKNLCVKAEEISLLPITVDVDGSSMKLEECCTIAKKDDYTFMIIPHYEEDMGALIMGVRREHPEFKLEPGTMEVDGQDADGNPRKRDVHYLLVSMPEVDDDRYEVLKDGVKLCYDDCKAQMEAANLKSDAVFAQYTVGESDEDLKLLEKGREKLNKQWDAKREEIYQKKIDEIDAAYNKWLGEQAQREIALMEEEDARGTNAGMSMKLNYTEN